MPLSHVVVHGRCEVDPFLLQLWPGWCGTPDLTQLLCRECEHLLPVVAPDKAVMKYDADQDGSYEVLVSVFDEDKDGMADVIHVESDLDGDGVHEAQRAVGDGVRA